MSEETRTTCPFCSLHCTDLRLTFGGGRMVGFTPACALGEAGYQAALSGERHRRPSRKAMHDARLRLQAARQPLIVLSGEVEQEAVTAAVRLAKQYSAILACDEDFTGAFLGPAMQAAGTLAGTLGDLHGQSLVVLCGVDPAQTHPRLGGRLGCDLANQALSFDPPDPLEAIRWLRLAASGAIQDPPIVHSEVVDRIKTASSGLVLFGSEWGRIGQPLITEMMLWLRDLDRDGRWYALYLPPAGNSIGVIETLLAETGYSGNLRFGPAGVEYLPHLWQADRLIQEGSVDLCLLVGCPGSFSRETVARLSPSRTILLGRSRPDWKPGIRLPAAQAGVDVPGWVQRLDGVPVELRPILPPHLPPLADILLELTES